MRLLAATCILSLVVAIPPAAAEEAVLSPSAVAIAAPDATGLTRIAVRFDLATLRSGQGRQIDQALLTWTPAGVTVDSMLTWSAYEITAAWTETGLAGGSEAPQCDEVELDSWEVTPFEAARDGEVLVRLDLQDLVARWASGETTNCGVFVLTPDVPAAVLQSQLGTVSLRVWYGFGPADVE